MLNSVSLDVAGFAQKVGNAMHGGAWIYIQVQPRRTPLRNSFESQQRVVRGCIRLRSRREHRARGGARFCERNPGYTTRNLLPAESGRANLPLLSRLDLNNPALPCEGSHALCPSFPPTTVTINSYPPFNQNLIYPKRIEFKIRVCLQATVKASQFLLQSCYDHATTVHLYAAFYSADTSTRSNQAICSSGTSKHVGSFPQLCT